MRAGICGMAAPGNPYLAARLAWTDGEVSHANNGILGEVFNAVMTSLAFVDADVSSIVSRAMDMIPKDSEYYSVIRFAWDCCQSLPTWQEALSNARKNIKNTTGSTRIQTRAARSSRCFTGKEISGRPFTLLPCAGLTWTVTQG